MYSVSSLESVFKLSLIMNMVDNLTGPMLKVQNSVGSSVSKIDNMSASLGNLTKTGATVAGIGSEITNAALSPVKATFETQKSLGELKSVGVKNLKALENAAKSFSDTWAGTTKAEFIGAAYDIKSGIASLKDEAVAKYTEMAGITAKGTKATIGEMTSLFATGYGIYKDFYKNMSDIDFGKLFAAGIGHAANIFKTDGPQMAEAISSLGAAATSAKVPMEEQFSILGMLQATMSGSESGTKYRAFLQSAAKAGEELGLKFTDANNQLLSMPEILSRLKGKFGETMDAAEKMKLTQAFGSDESVGLIDLLYTKTGNLQDNILSMYDSMGKGLTEVTDMANAINDTQPDQYEVLQQQIQNIEQTIGNNLLPTINEMLSKGKVILTDVSKWVGQNKELATNILLVLMALGIFLTVGGTAIAVIGGVGLIFTKTAGFAKGFFNILFKIPDLLTTVYIKALYAGDGIKKGFSVIRSASSTAITAIKNVAVNIATMAKTAAINAVNGLKNMAIGLANMAKQAVITAVKALPGLIATVWSFTSALLANPITWIVVGIIALIAAIILLWKNWDSVVSFLSKVWNGFVNGIKAGFTWIINLFSGMPKWLQIVIIAFLPFIGIPLLIIKNWGKITAFFASLGIKIKSGFISTVNNIKTFITGLPAWFMKSGAKIIDTLVKGILSAASKPVDAVKGIFAKVRKLLPFSDAKEGPLSTLTLSGHRTMSTIAQGIQSGENLPYEAVEKGLGKVDKSISREPKKVSLKEVYSSKEQTKETNNQNDRKIIIEKLLFNVDFKKLKDLPLLLSLISEIEDYMNSNGLITEGEN